MSDRRPVAAGTTSCVGSGPVTAAGPDGPGASRIPAGLPGSRRAAAGSPARVRPPTASQQSRELAPLRQLSFSVSEVVGLFLISAGAFAIPVVLPVVGLVLIWRSRTWRRADKGVATALVVLPIFLAAGVVGFILLLHGWDFG